MDFMFLTQVNGVNTRLYGVSDTLTHLDKPTNELTTCPYCKQNVIESRINDSQTNNPQRVSVVSERRKSKIDTRIHIDGYGIEGEQS